MQTDAVAAKHCCTLAPAALPMQLLRAVLVTTSIADWTPSLDPIRATLQSLECLDAAETIVVADALPTTNEAEALSPLDGDKWRELYVEKAQAYDTYLNGLQQLCDARPATSLIRQATFGHLVGSVRAGFASLECAADDVVLITQHDLALLRAPPVFSCVEINQCVGYPENYFGDLREPPRHRAAAITGTTSRRWRGASEI